ncbi:Gar1/Naf1 RNA binding region-domain-containing protein [Lentinula boryana]|uniref:H/ACA ribonucleoprotein complex subunit n=1 Tax=Lentinula boryana TaxID=40481 RepID=A0ABQ8PY91_9AGAR|nr:Gar1/Naf1 RNA binding region-domain-containing protein [Lentinula boryana]
MSRGGFRGFGRGRGQGGRGGFQQRDFGPPETVLEMGSCVHAVEDELLCSSTIADKVPYFNAPIYLQNKSVIGKVDEILGPINEVYFSIKMSEGVLASSFKKGDKLFIGGDKLLPIERFLPKPKVAGGVTSMIIPYALCPSHIQSLSRARSWRWPRCAGRKGTWCTPRWSTRWEGWCQSWIRWRSWRPRILKRGRGKLFSWKRFPRWWWWSRRLPWIVVFNIIVLLHSSRFEVSSH